MLDYLTGLLFTAFLLYILVDINFFLRIALLLIWHKLFDSRTRNIFEKTTHYGICMTMDVDFNVKHMNNVKYLREMDLVRFMFYHITGIFTEINRNGACGVQTATNIRYRRPIPLFSIFKLTTQLIHWDDKNIYLEHEFISLSDNFVYATILSKQTLTGEKVHVPDIIEKLKPVDSHKPEISEELKIWCALLAESSLKFKKLREKELMDVHADKKDC